jgi:hypothetical protein
MKTLGEIAREMWLLVDNNPIDWQAVADAVVAAHEARRWKPIESAPKNGETRVGWFGWHAKETAYLGEPEGRTPGWYTYTGREWRLEKVPPTHWMERLTAPLPAPPQEVECGE